MRVVEYDPSRRADVADLMARVWGERPDEAELEWFYEQQPGAAGVGAARRGGRQGRRRPSRSASSGWRSAARRSRSGCRSALATDPAYQGRGIFGSSRRRTRSASRELGVRLLLTVPNDGVGARLRSSRLGWTPLPLAPGLGAAEGAAGAGARGRVERFEPGAPVAWGGGDRVLRDGGWLNWRFADAPREYPLLEGDGYAAVGRRGRLGVVAAVEGDLLARRRCAPRGGRALIAAPPPWETRPLPARRLPADAAHLHAARQVARPPAARAAALRARRPRLPVSRLVFVTQQVDPEHPVLAATVPKIRALAARFDEVAVLAASAVDGVLPGQLPVRLYGSDSRCRARPALPRALAAS